MFEDLIKEMERLNDQSLSVPIDSDENDTDTLNRT